MPKPPVSELAYRAIEDVLAAHPDGISLTLLGKLVGEGISRRTLLNRLQVLLEQGRAKTEGQNRAVKYLPSDVQQTRKVAESERSWPTLSVMGQDVQKIISRPLSKRTTAVYNRDFLDSYKPNQTFYLSKSHRARLHKIGAVPMGTQPAGTYARKILDRLLIDLSFNSSRLEGNTYTLLDTKRLIDFGKEAVGKDRLEAQMILNHKEAIEFLVNAADEVAFDRRTLLNLHALLANNLLSNPQAEGRLRRIAVGIEGSTFQPLGLPQVIEECFHQILKTAQEIYDPFEQSFFIMVHLPYLQPFDDVNKRVSRLAANIPLIKANLIPLTFLDVPRDLYARAILGVYELNRIELLRDIYLWAYDRSAERYAATRESIGEPDPFRQKQREALREVVASIVRNKLKRDDAFQYLEEWTAQNVNTIDRPQFIDVAHDELIALHEGNFARYRLRPSEFDDWQLIWNKLR